MQTSANESFTSKHEIPVDKDATNETFLEGKNRKVQV